MRRIALFVLLFTASFAADAIDGCRALLCFAYPGDPLTLPACVTTVEEVMSELARGGAFPHCSLTATPAGSPAASASACGSANGGSALLPGLCKAP